MKLDKANFIYNKYRDFKGPDFVEKVLNELGVSYDINLNQLDNIPLKGGFITVSNHNFGSIDGMVLLSVIGHIRPDFKILTNYILSKIPALRDSFIAVDPFAVGRKRSVGGLKDALEHIAAGGCLGLFPAGEVATTKNFTIKRSKLKDTVRDIPWPSNMIRLIRNSGLPVVPIYFDGTNSGLFHLLGMIHPRLRTVKLIGEAFNKRGKTIPMRIGKPVSAEEIAEYTDLDELGGYLRSRVYAMQQEFVGRSGNPAAEMVGEGPVEHLALPGDKEAIMKDLEKIKSKMLFGAGEYQCYLADYEDIPNAMLEIGRLREDAFRAVGEGTNRARDLDSYDKYYKHLILWDTTHKKIAGAYRIGIGSEIMKSPEGRNGFYTSSLFDYKEGADEILPYCAELGRSFVNREYQKESISLMLLFKGLIYSMTRYPDIKYMVGAVSISNDYPRFYKSLMMYFLSSFKPCTYPKPIAECRCRFIPDYINVNPDDLLRHKMESVEKFDRFLMTISDGRFRLPTLLKIYARCGAQFICFNVDPAFKYCLDGLILMPLADIPKAELEPYLRGETTHAEKEAILKRYGYMVEDKEVLEAVLNSCVIQ